MHECIYLRSSRLLAKVALPGRGIYAQHRFDYTAFVPDVVLDGKHVVGVPEQIIPARWTSYGAGFCSGFNWQTPAREAGMGGMFLQPGVGVLTQKPGKTDWDIRGSYGIRMADFTWERSESAMSFAAESPVVSGFGAALRKVLSLQGNAMTVTTTLTNTGDRPIRECEEYNHNFLAIDGHPFDEGYLLDLPMIERYPEMPEGVLRTPGGIRLAAPRREPFFFRTDDVRHSPGPCWTLTRPDEGVRVSEEAADFAPKGVAVWGIEHVMSPEVFYDVQLLSGQSATWTRRWVFDNV